MQQFKNIGTEGWVDLVAAGLELPATIGNMGSCECRVALSDTEPTDPLAGVPLRVFGERQSEMEVAAGATAVWVRFTITPSSVNAR